MLYPHEGLVSLEKAAKALSAFAYISLTCISCFRTACSMTPRNLVYSTRRMFLLPIWMVGGLLASSLPFRSIITIFSLAEVHHFCRCCVTLVPMASKIHQLLPEKSTTRSSTYAITLQSPLLLRASRQSSKSEFQNLGPRIEPCGHPLFRSLHMLACFSTMLVNLLK